MASFQSNLYIFSDFISVFFFFLSGIQLASIFKLHVHYFSKCYTKYNFLKNSIVTATEEMHTSNPCKLFLK